MARLGRIPAAFLFAAMLGLSPAQASSPPLNEEVDLIADHPSGIENVVDITMSALSTVASTAGELFSMVLPPSPSSLVKSGAKEDKQALISLLGYAGYKLKEIDSQVGIIPTIAFKFALVRELSEADWDYLAERLEVSRFQTPGLGAAIQRAIVETVMNINTGGAYQVSELKVQILPLPKVAFSASPKIATLGEESSSLMRAIQRMEKRVRGDLASLGSRVLPRGMVKGWLEVREWLIGAAILLFALSILVGIRHQLSPVDQGRSGPVVMLVLLGLGAGCWIGFSLIPLSLVTLAAGVAVFGLTALVFVGRSSAEPKAAAVPVVVPPAAPSAAEAVETSHAAT